MARSEIAEKIKALLTASGGWSESTVVYFLVEVRKLLDYQRERERSDHPHLRFYCDWMAPMIRHFSSPLAGC